MISFNNENELPPSSQEELKNLINETIKLPVSFIIGANFISGSLIGTFLTTNLTKKN